MRSMSYWNLNRNFHLGELVSDDFLDVKVANERLKEHDVQGSLAEGGYIVQRGILPVGLIVELQLAIHKVHAAGWPRIAVLIYDEPWVLIKNPSKQT
jgi:hypothetical protein